ncbi:MAG TPA: hypothetical protein VGC67_03590 [Cellulomonas sp.]
MVVIGDRYGAPTLGAVERFGLADVRTRTDRPTGEIALVANAERLGRPGRPAPSTSTRSS